MKENENKIHSLTGNYCGSEMGYDSHFEDRGCHRTLQKKQKYRTSLDQHGGQAGLKSCPGGSLLLVQNQVEPPSDQRQKKKRKTLKKYQSLGQQFVKENKGIKTFKKFTKFETVSRNKDKWANNSDLEDIKSTENEFRKMAKSLDVDSNDRISKETLCVDEDVRECSKERKESMNAERYKNNQKKTNIEVKIKEKSKRGVSKKQPGTLDKEEPSYEKNTEKLGNKDVPEKDQKHKDDECEMTKALDDLLESEQTDGDDELEELKLKVELPEQRQTDNRFNYDHHDGEQTNRKEAQDPLTVTLKGVYDGYDGKKEARLIEEGDRKRDEVDDYGIGKNAEESTGVDDMGSDKLFKVHGHTKILGESGGFTVIGHTLPSELDNLCQSISMVYTRRALEEHTYCFMSHNSKPEETSILSLKSCDTLKDKDDQHMSELQAEHCPLHFSDFRHLAWLRNRLPMDVTRLFFAWVKEEIAIRGCRCQEQNSQDEKWKEEEVNTNKEEFGDKESRKEIEEYSLPSMEADHQDDVVDEAGNGSSICSINLELVCKNMADNCGEFERVTEVNDNVDENIMENESNDDLEGDIIDAEEKDAQVICDDYVEDSKKNTDNVVEEGDEKRVSETTAADCKIDDSEAAEFANEDDKDSMLADGIQKDEELQEIQMDCKKVQSGDKHVDKAGEKMAPKGHWHKKLYRMKIQVMEFQLKVDEFEREMAKKMEDNISALHPFRSITESFKGHNCLLHFSDDKRNQMHDCCWQKSNVDKHDPEPEWKQSGHCSSADCPFRNACKWQDLRTKRHVFHRGRTKHVDCKWKDEHKLKPKRGFSGRDHSIFGYHGIGRQCSQQTSGGGGRGMNEGSSDAGNTPSNHGNRDKNSKNEKNQQSKDQNDDNNNNYPDKNSAKKLSSGEVTLSDTTAAREVTSTRTPEPDFKGPRKKKHVSLEDLGWLDKMVATIMDDEGPSIRIFQFVDRVVYTCVSQCLAQPEQLSPDGYMCSVCNTVDSLLRHYANCSANFNNCDMCVKMFSLICSHVDVCAGKEAMVNCDIRICRVVMGLLDGASVVAHMKTLWIQVRKKLARIIGLEVDDPPVRRVPRASVSGIISGTLPSIPEGAPLSGGSTSRSGSRVLARKVSNLPNVKEQQQGVLFAEESTGAQPQYQVAGEIQDNVDDEQIDSKHGLPAGAELSEVERDALPTPEDGGDSFGSSNDSSGTFSYAPGGIRRFVSLPMTPVGPKEPYYPSFKDKPTGMKGIDEVVYANKQQLVKVVTVWELFKEQYHIEAKLAKHYREEGVILSEFKSKLKIKGLRYNREFQWVKIAPLGNGMTGKCFLASDFETDFKFCVKELHIANYEKEEIVLWSDLDHPNIVQVYGAIRHGERIYILQEFIEGGCLTEAINGQRKLGRRLSQLTALKFFRELLQVLKYLKGKSILHEDIKADNILLNKSAKGVSIKVTDFGLAHKCTGIVRQGTKPFGTQTQWSPEKAKADGYSFPAEVWAAVCVLVHMLSGLPPWMKRYENLRVLIVVIAENSPPLQDVPRNIQQQIQDLIHAGFTLHPGQRPTAEQLLDHPAFLLLEHVQPVDLYSILESVHVESTNQISDDPNADLREIYCNLEREENRIVSSANVTGLVSNMAPDCHQQSNDFYVYTAIQSAGETTGTSSSTVATSATSNETSVNDTRNIHRDRDMEILHQQINSQGQSRLPTLPYQNVDPTAHYEQFINDEVSHVIPPPTEPDLRPYYPSDGSEKHSSHHSSSFGSLSSGKIMQKLIPDFNQLGVSSDSESRSIHKSTPEVSFHSNHGEAVGKNEVNLSEAYQHFDKNYLPTVLNTSLNASHNVHETTQQTQSAQRTDMSRIESPAGNAPQMAERPSLPVHLPNSLSSPALLDQVYTHQSRTPGHPTGQFMHNTPGKIDDYDEHIQDDELFMSGTPPNDSPLHKQASSQSMIASQENISPGHAFISQYHTPNYAQQPYTADRRMVSQSPGRQQHPYQDVSQQQVKFTHSELSNNRNFKLVEGPSLTPTSRTSPSYTPLHHQPEPGPRQNVGNIVPPPTRTSPGFTPLHHQPGPRSNVGKGVPPPTRTSPGYTPMHHQHEPGPRQNVGNIVPPPTRTSPGYTPMHHQHVPGLHSSVHSVGQPNHGFTNVHYLQSPSPEQHHQQQHHQQYRSPTEINQFVRPTGQGYTPNQAFNTLGGNYHIASHLYSQSGQDSFLGGQGQQSLGQGHSQAGQGYSPVGHGQAAMGHKIITPVQFYSTVSSGATDLGYAPHFFSSQPQNVLNIVPSYAPPRGELPISGNGQHFPQAVQTSMPNPYVPMAFTNQYGPATMNITQLDRQHIGASQKLAQPQKLLNKPQTLQGSKQAMSMGVDLTTRAITDPRTVFLPAPGDIKFPQPNQKHYPPHPKTPILNPAINPRPSILPEGQKVDLRLDINRAQNMTGATPSSAVQTAPVFSPPKTPKKSPDYHRTQSQLPMSVRRSPSLTGSMFSPPSQSYDKMSSSASKTQFEEQEDAFRELAHTAEEALSQHSDPVHFADIFDHDEQEVQGELDEIDFEHAAKSLAHVLDSKEDDSIVVTFRSEVNGKEIRMRLGSRCANKTWEKIIIEELDGFSRIAIREEYGLVRICLKTEAGAVIDLESRLGNAQQQQVVMAEAMDADPWWVEGGMISQ